MKKGKWKKWVAALFMLTLMFQVMGTVVNASNGTKSDREKIQDTYVKDLMNAVNRSDKLNARKYKIKIISGQATENIKGHWIKCNSTQDVVKYLEKNEKQMEVARSFVISEQEKDECGKDVRKNAMKKQKSVTKSYSRGFAPKYTLKATFTYDTKTKKIKSVTNRKFSLSGITLAIGAEDKTYSTTYSSTKKTATVKCSYTAVSYLITPVGRIEIERRDAYQKFSYSVSKGVTGGEGGYE